ncbi:MAG: replication protein A [Cuniculiplasma sp.]
MESSKNLKIAEIKGEVMEINVKAKILSLSKREVQSAKGPLTYHYGLIGDETGVMPFTAWSFPTTVRENDVYEISKCYTKSYKEKLRIYFDNRTEFKLLTETMEVKRTYKYYEIKDLNLNDKFVTVEGLVTSENRREYEKDGEKREVFQYILKDQTATIPLSSFGKKLEAGKYARIEGARLDEFNGYYRLNMSDKANVEYINIDLKDEEKIMDIVNLRGAVGGITVTGFIINMGEKSGLVVRCSECNLKVDDIRCSDHPEAPLKYDTFAYFTIDDGTDYLQVSAGFEALKEIANINREYLDNPQRPPLKKEVKEKIESALTHHALKIKGNLRINNMGISLRSTEISAITEDLVKSLKSEINGGSN